MNFSTLLILTNYVELSRLNLTVSMLKIGLYIVLIIATFRVNAQDKSYYRRIIGVLASDSLQGRAGGSSYEYAAAKFIAKEFSVIDGCRAKLQSFRFNEASKQLKSQNVLAYIDHQAPRTILLSAHYDHIGLGGELSMSQGLHEVHNGADDNASGIALMLALAKVLSTECTTYNFIFVAYGAHEKGLYGSSYFFKKAKKYRSKLDLCINFDMMGRMNNNWVYMDGSVEILDDLMGASTDQIKFTKSTIDRINTLDSKWLFQDGVPSLTFSTGRHLDYHKVSDDLEYINFEGMAIIHSALIKWFDKKCNS